MTEQEKLERNDNKKIDELLSIIDELTYGKILTDVKLKDIRRKAVLKWLASL